MKVYLHGLVHGYPTEDDNRWLVEYDPAGPGRPLLKTTRDRADARRFDDFRAAIDYISRSRGTRPDGRPDRPLTAYNLEFVPDSAPDPPRLRSVLRGR